MKRLAFVALVAAACGRVSEVEPGPADQFYRPTGIGVYAGKLLVASSNSDLRYDDATGGTIIAVDPSAEPASLAGSLGIRSFAGQMAIVDPAAGCPVANPAAGAVALVPVRGEDLLYRVRVSTGGALSCEGCSVSLGGAQAADPFSVGVACGPGVARAYVGYLRSTLGQAIVAQVDLSKEPSDAGFLQRAAIGSGQVRAFAYDAPRKRLYFTRTVTGASSSLGFIDLADGCELEPVDGALGCTFGATAAGAVPTGLELRGIVLASSEVQPRRVYLTARIFDPVAAAAAGVRIGDFDGRLLVADLVENLAGRLELHLVREIEIGYGAADLVALPARPGKRDVVAALGVDDGVLWLYDDEAGELVQFGRDDVTGGPIAGHVPFGLAVDPAPVAGVARVYVGSFEESFVTAIDVPLDDPRAACLVAAGGGCAATPDEVRRIKGGVTP